MTPEEETEMRRLEAALSQAIGLVRGRLKIVPPSASDSGPNLDRWDGPVTSREQEEANASREADVRLPLGPTSEGGSGRACCGAALRERDAAWKAALELSHYDSIDGPHMDYTTPAGEWLGCNECAPLRALLEEAGK